MATVSKWTPFGVALNLTATGSNITRKSATQFTVTINASWETYWDDARTNYGMSATSGGVTKTISAFDGTKRSSGSGSFTGTYSISGNGAATKTITVTFKNFNTDNGDSASKNVTFNVSVPAWTSYTVKYNANGGSGAPGSQTKWKDQTLTLSNTKPTRTGYSFVGWNNISSTATEATHSAGGSYTTNASTTFYAVWKANTYTITYNANGGSGAPAKQTKTYGKTLTLSSTIPTRTNYNFKGWSTSASATTATYAAGGSYTANSAATLYAVWELAYTKPRIEWVEVFRVNPASETSWDGYVESDAGEYLNVRFRYSTDRAPTIRIEMDDEMLLQVDRSADGTYDVWEAGDYLEENNTQIECSLESSHTVKITVSDSGGSTTKTVVIPSAIIAIDVMPENKGVAIGKTSEEEGVFDVGYKTRFFGGVLQPVLEPDTDLNDVKTPNIYSGENASNYNYGNCPITSGTFTLEVKAAGPNGQTYQKLTVCDKKAQLVYERYFYTNAWGDWFGGWIYPTLGSEFTMYGTSEADNKTKYRKDGRLVELRGIVKPVADIAGGTANHTICTLQDGYRPSSPIYLLCQGSSNCSWLLKIGTDGDVGFSRYRNGDATATAAAGTWLPFQATFFIK